MSEFKVRVEIKGAVGYLRWGLQQVTVETLERAISLATDDALIAHNLRRVQVELPAPDRAARRALHRCGFRLEGQLRDALQRPDDTFDDIVIYSRLATDIVYGPMGFSGVMDTVLPTKRVIAHVVFTNEQGQVLLAQTTYKQDWELPGGVVDVGETPRQGAQREVLEEIGLAFELGDPVLTDWMPPSLNWSDAIEFLFDGGVLPPNLVAAIQPADGEIHSLHWVEPDDLDNHVTELSARRIRLVLAGYQGMSEDGHPLDAG